jgi:PAS domain S-box-containing protein
MGDSRSAEQIAQENAELVRGQNHVLELIAHNTPLSETLDALVRVIEKLSPDMLGSILLLDPDGLRVRHGAAPSLPETYNRAIDGEPIGPKAGSCGTAAFRREPVIVEDIATDPLWENYRDFALRHGLRACWSTPIFEENVSEQRPVLGTFALYYHSPRLPSLRHRELIEMATQTAAIAIAKTRAEEELKRREAQLVEAQRIAHIGSYEWDILSDKVYRSRELCHIFGLSPDEFEPTFEGYLKRVHPEDRASTKEIIEQAFREGKSFDHEERIVRPDGSVRILRSQGEFVSGKQGVPVKLVGICQDITDRKRTEQQLQAANTALAQELRERAKTERELHALSAQLSNAQEEERARLARELHDDINQQIAALSIKASSLRAGIPPEFTDARAQISHIQEKLIVLTESIRRISHQLHPAILQFSGLDVALRTYCSEFAALAGITVAFHSEGSFEDVPEQIALSVYRIAQEALGNVVKHAQTNHADVALTRSLHALNLTVSDSGIGLDLNGAGVSQGLGLISIKERTRLVNGTLEIQSKPNQGTALSVTLPC